ncbi:MAG: hypothetical protein HY554_04165 [Elusimicrobia bacterium]|nr:hypothetical protein [Elusimicrobiota bacterium]
MKEKTIRILLASLALTAAAAGPSAAGLLMLQASEPIPLEETGTVAPVVFRLVEGHPDSSVRFPAGRDFLVKVAAWQLQILDADGRKVGYLQGRGAPPAGPIPWFGVDPSGELLPDGFYRARFVWLDESKRAHGTDTTTFGLHTTGVARLGNRWLQDAKDGRGFGFGGKS